MNLQTSLFWPSSSPHPSFLCFSFFHHISSGLWPKQPNRRLFFWPDTTWSLLLAHTALSVTQPFPNPAVGAHERFERYLGNDISSTQRHLRAKSTGRPVTIRYLACHPHSWQVVCTIMFMTYYHGYTALNRLISELYHPRHHPSCHGPTPRRPFIIINLILLVKF